MFPRIIPVLLISLISISSHAHSPMGVNDPYDDHGIEGIDEMMAHAGFGSYLFQNDPHNYGSVLVQGEEINLVNTAGPTEMPIAGFTHFLDITPHFFADGALTRGSFTAILNTPSRRISKNYSPGENPLGFLLYPMMDGFSGKATITVMAGINVVARHTATWNFDEPECGACTTGAGACSLETEIGSAKLKIPLGGNSYGLGANHLTFKSGSLSNPGAAALKFVGSVGANGSTVNRSGNTITSVITGNTLATILPASSSEDENRFEVHFSYVNDPRPNPPSPVFRSVVVEIASGRLRISDTNADQTVTREFANASPDVWILEEAGLRRTTRTIISSAGGIRVSRIREEEKNGQGVWKTISLREIGEKAFASEWQTIRSTLDPEGSALTTTYEYHLWSPDQSGTLDIGASGRLKREVRPDGMTRTFEYLPNDPFNTSFDRVDVIKEHFAGTAEGRETRIHRKFQSVTSTVLEEVFVLGNLVSKKETISTGTTRIEKVYPSEDQPPLVTQTTFSSGAFETIHPDGRVLRESKAVVNDQLVKTTQSGVKNTGSGHYLIRGEEKVTTFDRAGNILREVQKLVHGGVSYPIEDRRTAAQDDSGRRTRVDVFLGNGTAPAFSEHLSYSCCGLASETGRDGITSQHFYDALGRRWKTSRGGISEETIRDGPTVRVHRYPEALPGPASLADSSNELSNTTYNLAGEIVSSQERSPKDGTWVTTSVQTTYSPGGGMGKTVTRTYPQTADDQGVTPTITESHAIDGNLIGRSGSMAVHESISYSSNATGIVETRSKVDGTGQPFETEIHQQDWTGRKVAITYAGDQDGDNNPDREILEYDTAGRLSKTVDPDGVATLSSEDPANGISITALDVNGNGVIDPAVDQLTIRREGVGLDAAGKVIRWRESAARVGDGQGGSVEVTLSRIETSADGLKQTAVTYGGAGRAATTTSTTKYTAPGAWKVITMRPDATFAIGYYENGLLDRVEEYSTQGVLVSSLEYSHDAYNRVIGVTDSRGPATSYQYVAPLVDFIAQTTVGTRVSVTGHDERGRTILNDEPDSLDDSGNPVANVRVTHYWPFGGVREETGTPGYRVTYTYDAARRMETMTTYGTATAVTRWEYDPDRGWLVRKRHNSPSPGQGSGESHTYTPGGRLHVRTLARGVTGTYSYATSGALGGIVYSDSTPAVTIHGRDQLGRVTRLTDGAGERVLAYDGWGELGSETHSSGGILGGWEVTQGRDSIGRLSGIGTALTAGGASHAIAYGYGKLGRPESVTSGGATATYRHHPTHQRVSQIDFSAGAEPFLHGGMTYDSLLRLDRITYHNGQTSGGFKLFSDFRYTRDGYGNITSAQRMDGTKNLYGYNPAGEVVADRRLRDAAGNEFLRGQSFRWSYDGIGNRLTSAAGGDTNGQNLRVSTHTPNALNQYSAIQNPGAADVTGVADGQANVTINGSAATRQGDWFHGEVGADNSAGPVWKATSVSDGTDTTAGSLLIPPATRNPQYDADGNLTSDGVYGYTWDGENRLIKIETLPAAVSAGVPYQRVEMAYDSQWRRIRREQFDSLASVTPIKTTRYLWAGWRCLAELGAADSLAKCHVWGLDQAHQLHLGDSNNALLWTHDLIRDERHFCHYDGNGNVAGLSDAAGNHTAEYFHNAFGVVTGKRGSYADENDYRFSTKPFEEVGGLYYYGYRYLDPIAGRWMSRDPKGERGSLNLMAFLANNSLDGIDILGLEKLSLRYVLESESEVKAAVRQSGGVGFTSLGAMMEDAKKRTTPYSKDGKAPCNCISNLVLLTHGSEGMIQFPDGSSLTGADLEDYRKNPIRKMSGNKGMNMHIIQMGALNSLMCEGASIDFRSCSAGLGDSGTALLRELRLIFPGKTIILHRGTCYTNLGGLIEFELNGLLPKKPRFHKGRIGFELF